MKNKYKATIEEPDMTTTLVVENYTIGAALAKVERMYPCGEVVAIIKQ